MNMTPRIYKIINDLNDKVYVGQTFKTVEARFSRHCGEARWRNTKKMPIVMAIRKYGSSHFKVILLEELPENSTQSFVDSKEIEWGMRLNCLAPIGYNLKLGSGNGYISDETKQKIRRSQLGRKATDETRRRLSISHLGHRNSVETRRKLSDVFRGKSPHKNTAIGASNKNSKTYALKSPDGTEIVVTNMRKFCEQMGFWRSNMSRLVTGKLTSYKGWTMIKDLGFNNIKRH